MKTPVTYGKHETEINALIAFMQEAGAINFRKLEQDGKVGSQFDIALNDLLKKPDRNTEMAAKVRDACRLLEQSCRERRMTSARWGKHYDMFIAWLDAEATKEREARGEQNAGHGESPRKADQGPPIS